MSEPPPEETGPEITLLYWSECPSWRRALTELREEVSAAGLDPDGVRVREVGEEALARELGFPGSPTVRIDGRDVEPPGEAPIGLTCRVYRRPDGRVSPLPDRELVAAAIREGLKGDRG